MKNVFLFMVLVTVPLLVSAQDQYKVSFDAYQEVEEGSTSLKSLMKLPIKDTIIVMGGLNDLDGMNNYFNIFGGKLIIDRMEIASNGTKNLILRREDGRNFYDLFPTLSAKLIPITLGETEALVSN